MNRLTVIQAVINAKQAQSYLEIGVNNGAVFFRVKAKRKIAVDPRFAFSTFKQFRYFLKNPFNLFNKCYETTSDDYFQHRSAEMGNTGIDVAFVDGLHTYAQALKDVQNCLRYLNPGGVIILHDCSPPSESAAFPAASVDHALKANLPGWTGDWCGDVWKMVVDLRSTERDLNIFVLDCDMGVGIVTRGTPENMLRFSKEEIDLLTFTDLDRKRQEFLNLKKPEFLVEFLEK